MTKDSKLWIAAFALITVAFAGCTNDEDLGGRESPSGQTLSQVEYCANASNADASSSCGGNRAEKICGDQYSCLVKLLDVEAANVFLSCQKPKICGENASPAGCKEMIAQKAPLHTTESQKCFSRYEECKSGGAGKDPFDDDLCEYVIGMKADVLTDYSPCFEKACGEVQQCLQSVLASRGLNDCPE